MADVRSMLRNERQARRLNHPHLAYSTTGTIVCLVCHIQLKSVHLWNKHLLSDYHAMRLQRIRDNALGRPPGAPPPPEEPDDQPSESANGSKKRKADDLDDEDARKKSKPAAIVDPQYLEEAYTAQFDLSDSDEERVASAGPKAIVWADPEPAKSKPSSPHAGPTSPKTADNDGVDEEEWAAFERDVATPPPEASALTAEASISAAPISAAELAAQSVEEASAPRKSLREAELEGEKEDAARQMEEELDEMAELEDRVKKLREQREKLRVANAESKHATGSEGDDGDHGIGEDDEKDDVEDSSDEIDEWARWAH